MLGLGLVAPLVLGWVFIVVLIPWVGMHLLRGRPRWYVDRILKAALVGGGLGVVPGLAVILSLHEQDELLLSFVFLFMGLFGVSGAGWAGVGAAAWYAEHRLSRCGPPPKRMSE